MLPIKVKFLGITTRLTYGKVYDVMEVLKDKLSNKANRYLIMDNEGVEAGYFLASLFQDVTAEYRNSVIDEILI